MTEDQGEKLEALHRFFIEPRAPGKPSRAEELDDALAALRAGKFGARSLLWLCGAIAALSAAWATMKGWAP